MRICGCASLSFHQVFPWRVVAVWLKRKLRLHQSLPRAATLDGSDRLSAWLARIHRHVTLRCRTRCCRPRIRQPLCIRPSFLRRSGASVAVFGKSLCVTSFEFGSLGRATIHGDGALSRRPRMQFGEQARARARGKMVCFARGNSGATRDCDDHCTAVVAILVAPKRCFEQCVLLLPARAACAGAWLKGAPERWRFICNIVSFRI